MTKVSPAPKQAKSPAGETDGFKAPGGGLRASIRDRIASVAAYDSKIVEVPEWGVAVEIRSMSLAARNGLFASVDGNLDMQMLYPHIVALCTYDPESGERVFGDDDIEFLNTRPAAVIDRIAIPALELCGMTEAAVDDEAKKSSQTDTSE